MTVKSNKTRIDLRLEKYLLQEGIISFLYEPFSKMAQRGIKNPDYLVRKDKKALIEVKEIESIPLDRVKGVGSLDAMAVANILRDKIYEAAKQLKPHKNKVEYNIILLGKAQGFDLHTLDLEWAMYGDPVIKVPINVKKGSPRGKAEFDYKVKGALRKNHPVSKQMYFPHSYISAVGIIKEKNGYNYYLDKLYKKHSSPYSKDAPLSHELSRVLKEYDVIKRKYEHTLPQEFLDDKEKSIYSVHIVSNALSTKPLPKDFFNGKYDWYKIHRLVSN